MNIDYDFYKELNDFELAEDLEISYIIPNRCIIKPRSSYLEHSWDFNKLESNNRHFIFTSNGIIYCEGYLISQDGKRLLSINGKNVLSLEDVKRFNIEQEKTKLEKILEGNNTFHPYTLAVLLEVIANLEDKQEFVNKILNFYLKDIPLCQDVVDAREDIISRINNYIFSNEELLHFEKLLLPEIKKTNVERKNENDFYNSPDESTKRLVKSLSEESLNSLKKYIK